MIASTGDVWANVAYGGLSFGAALFGWLARRSGKVNSQKLDKITEQTNGQLEAKIRQAIREEVSHDELVRAVSQEAIGDYLDGLLYARLNDQDTPSLLRPYGNEER